MGIGSNRAPFGYKTEADFFKAFQRATEDSSKLDPALRSAIQSLDVGKALPFSDGLMDYIYSRDPFADSTIRWIKTSVKEFLEHSDRPVEDRVNVLGAQIFAATNVEGIVEEIERRGIESPDDRLEILKIAVTRQKGLASWVRDLKITDQKTIVDLVKTRLKQDSDEVFDDIQKYGIQEREAKVEILQAVAEHCHSDLRKWMEKCEVTDENLFVELVKTRAQHQYLFSKYVPKLEITDPKVLIAIAKVAVKREPSFFDFLGNYNIKDQQTLVEIAKIGANSNISLCREFDKLGIEEAL